jgi:hypothetical protein
MDAGQWEIQTNWLELLIHAHQQQWARAAEDASAILENTRGEERRSMDPPAGLAVRSSPLRGQRRIGPRG